MKKGFTLIEMTIVVVIIGILAASLLPKLTSGMNKAENAGATKDVNDIVTALEMYKMDNGNTYPVSVSCNGTIKTECTLSGVYTALSTYLRSIPKGNTKLPQWIIGNGNIVPAGNAYGYIGTGQRYILSYYFVDTRDDQRYKAVRMPDERRWMAENLNYKTANSSCYNNDQANCIRPYGRTYTWDDAQTACPIDWYLPSDNEWTTMLNKVESVYGGVQNHAESGGWKGTSAGWQLQIVQAGSAGKDSFGFSMFLTGADAGWAIWSSTPYNSTAAFNRNFQRVNNSHMILHGAGGKSGTLFVRCIRK